MRAKSQFRFMDKSTSEAESYPREHQESQFNDTQNLSISHHHNLNENIKIYVQYKQN